MTDFQNGVEKGVIVAKKPERFVLGQFDNELNRSQVLHGSGAGVSFIDRSHFELPIRREHLSALGLSEGSVLYGTLLKSPDPTGTPETGEATSKKRLEQLALPPFATLIASPVPPPAWNRGVRICFSTTQNRSGQLADLILALRSCGLLVRHTYAVSGLDSERSLAIGSEGREFPLASHSRTPSQPSVVLTIEYMNKKAVRPPSTADDSLKHKFKKSERDVLLALHRYIEAWSSQTPDYRRALRRKAYFVGKLGALLQRGVIDPRTEEHRETGQFRIEWLSPLQTLQTLSSAIATKQNEQGPETPTFESATTDNNHHSETPSPESSASREDPRPEVTLRVKTSVSDERNLCISVEPWRRTLDPKARMSIEEAASPGQANQCAVVTVDTEERTLTAHLIPIERFAVAQFEVTHPAGRLQDFWKEWIFNEIKKHEGVVLQTFSQGRLDERWARELVVCYFPFLDEATSIEKRTPIVCRKELEKIARCFRALQGFTRNGTGGWLDKTSLDETRDFDFPSEGLKALFHQLSDARLQRISDLMPEHFKGPELLQRKDSTLRDVKLWYRWPSNSAYKARDAYVVQPFDFTQPLGFDRYSRLYTEKLFQQQGSRIRLVIRLMRLVASNTGERSALLLGPYRSGKTSVLTMVRELLNSEEERGKLLKRIGERDQKDEIEAFFRDQKILCIDINATVTPPHLLIVEIFRKLQALAEASSPISTLAKKMVNEVARVFERLFGLALTASLEIFLAPLPKSSRLKLSFLGLGKPKPGKPANQLLQREKDSPWDTVEGRAAFLRGSMAVLREAVKKLGDDGKLVITLDEVAATAAWDNEIAFPVWRNMIESPDFSKVRWILTSSRPLVEATAFSPLGNAVREFLMRPLSESEADALISNFDTRIVVRDGQEDRSQSEKTPIVVTYEAREYLKWVTGAFPYLLQVVCTHLYEQVTAYHIPIVSQPLLRHVIRRKVIPELSDYFETQKRHLEGPLLEKIYAALCGEQNPLKYSSINLGGVNLIERRKLQMSGVGWAEGDCVVSPLFLYWLWSSQS
ncbi:MAG: hypothetical protein AAFX75_04340 [Pseudomonadota bacterium]